MDSKYKSENEFETVLERLVEISADFGAEEVHKQILNKDLKDLKEENEELKKSVDYHKGLYKNELKSREDAERRFLGIHKQFMKYKTEQEKPITKNIIESFLILLFKEKLISTDKQTWIAIIKIYRYLTGEKLLAIRDTIDDIINNIDDIDIVSKPINVCDIKIDDIVNIKRNKTKITTDLVKVEREDSVLKTVLQTTSLHEKDLDDVYNKLGRGVQLNKTMRSSK